MDIELLWQKSLAAPISGCPGIVECEGHPLIVVGTDRGEVIALDGAGNERWRDRPGGVLQGWPTVIELRTGPLVIVGDHFGRIHAYGSDGTVRWRVSLGDLSRSELFNSGISPWSGVARLDGWRPAALVVTDRGGQVSALTVEGDILWQAHFAEDGICAPAVGDLDGDGMDEIVVTGFDGRVNCLAADGSRRWEADILPAEGGYHAPLMVDWGEGPRVLLLGEREAQVRCLDGEGKEVWRRTSDGGIGIQFGIAPLLVDGRYRFFVAYGHTGQCILTPTGEEVWHAFYGGGNQPFGPSVADVDGDGRLEVLMTRRGNATLWILGDDGREIFSFDMGGTMQGAPVVADVDGDGVPEFLVVTSETGRIRAFRARNAQPGGSVLWPTSRGPFDGRRSLLRERAPTPSGPKARAAMGVRLRREEPKALATGLQPLRYVVSGETSADAVLSVEVTGPDRIRHLYTPRLNDPEHGRVNASEEGAYHLSARLFGEGGEVIAETTETVHFVPFAVEKEHAERLIGELEGLLAEARTLDASSAVSLTRQGRKAISHLNRLVARTENPGEDQAALADEMRESLRLTERLIAVQARAREHRGASGGAVEMLLWSPDHPWVPFSPTTDAPSGPLLDEVRVRTEQRAHEAVVIAIANIAAEPLTVRLWWDPWQGGEQPPGNGALTVRHQVFVPTARGNMAPDALPKLDEAGLVMIPSGEAARIWLEFASGEAAPGSYATHLYVRALTVAGQVWEVPIAWDVLPLALPERSPLSFHVWAYENRQFFGNLDLVYRDLIEHYVNVFDLPLPRALYQADGSLQDLDWSATDRVIERVPPGSFFLWSAQEGVVQPEQGAPPVGSETWHQAFRAFVRQLVAHLAERGVDYDHHANYILDEPGTEGGRKVEEFIRVATLFKAADPNIKMFCNPAGGATREHVERLLAVSDVLDPIWQYSKYFQEYPHLRLILERAPVVWTYACADGAKDCTRMRYYWAPIWKGAQLGLTGIGFWSYAGRGVDFWQGPTPSGCDWELVYHGNGTIIPSHRWLGLRIGVEDYMRLWMLREAAKKLRERGDSARGEFLDSRRSEIVQRVLDADLDEGVIRQARRELQELLMGEGVSRE